MHRTSLTLLSLVAAAGCGGDATTGVRVALRTQVQSDLGADRTFTTSRGWAVTLEGAWISTGALYYFDGEPAFTYAPPPLRRRIFDALTLTSLAYAHPGHYVAGNAMGEQLAPFSADLLAVTPTSLPDGRGVSGAYRSATFSFSAPTAGPALTQLSGHAARAVGRATKDGRTVHFEAVADVADLAATAKDAAITGCAFEAADVQADGTVTVTVSPRVWFNLVDFADVAEGSAEAPTLLAPESTARIAFALGLTQLSAYHLTFGSP